jgi:predicted nucleic acid-binding protein
VSKILLDSWAWLEIFHGTQTGAEILKRVKSTEMVYTTTANVFEVMYRIEKDEGIDIAFEKKDVMEKKSIILPITMEIVVKALACRKKEKLAAIDSFTLSAALLNNAVLVTGDPDFKNVKNVIYVGK